MSRVNELIDRVMAEHPSLGVTAQARYYEEVHQHLAPLARELEMENNRLRTVATEALELTKYAAAAFAYTEAGNATPEWFEGLREQLETLQPKLMDAVTPNVK